MHQNLIQGGESIFSGQGCKNDDGEVSLKEGECKIEGVYAYKLRIFGELS